MKGSEPITAKAWINGEAVPLSLDYEFQATLRAQGLTLDVEVTPEGMEIAVRGGPLSPARMLSLLAALHETGKTGNLLELMAKYPVRIKLLGVSLRLRHS